MRVLKSTFLAIFLFAAWVGSSFALPQSQQDQSAKQDMKDPGHSTKNAAQDTGRATKKTAKKTGHAVKHTTKKATHKTAQKKRRRSEGRGQDQSQLTMLTHSIFSQSRSVGFAVAVRAVNSAQPTSS